LNGSRGTLSHLWELTKRKRTFLTDNLMHKRGPLKNFMNEKVLL